MDEFDRCKKTRKCTKSNKHSGKCNKEMKSTPFWETSTVILSNQARSEVKVLESHIDTLTNQRTELDADISVNDARKIHVSNEVNQLLSQKVNVQNALQKIVKKYDKMKALFDQKETSKHRCELNPTDKNMINDVKSSQRYARQAETKDLLQYVHGGEQGSFYGAWDYLSRYASHALIEKLMLDYKRGKFIEKLYGNFSTTFIKSPNGINQAVAKKYACFLSRRKFNFMCKIQSSTFDSETQEWSNKSISYGDQKLNLRDRTLSHQTVQKFVDGLDIGEVHSIPGYCGVSRTVTALVTMIIKLHLSVPSLKEKLRWFNSQENHFIIEFSDDGTPECKDTTMSVGTVMLWNLNSRVRSREYQYPLHVISCGEKDEVMDALWNQHTEEMQLIEGNVLNIDGVVVTTEFQPSADQAWQFWENNELTQSATYPSMFAKGHKSELGLIGQEFESRWEIPTLESRNKDLEKLGNFLEILPVDIVPEKKKQARLKFMAANGLRQLGKPRINSYANRQRPEPLHLEINNWEHAVNLLYQEAVRRGLVSQLCETLRSNPVNGGCGLKMVAKNIEEHFSNEKIDSPY